MNSTAAINIHRLENADSTTLEQINSLLPQLNPNVSLLTLEQLSAIIHAKANIIHVAIDEKTGRIVGMALLVVVRQFVGTKCWIEDVVVSSDYRKLGIGRLLVQATLAAVPKDTLSINLTSNPARESAHRLYAELGFEIRDTTVFRFTPAKKSSSLGV